MIILIDHRIATVSPGGSLLIFHHPLRSDVQDLKITDTPSPNLRSSERVIVPGLLFLPSYLRAVDLS